MKCLLVLVGLVVILSILNKRETSAVTDAVTEISIKNVESLLNNSKSEFNHLIQEYFQEVLCRTE